MSPRILVADDSWTMRQIVVRSLTALGFARPVQAADGEEALAAFGRGGFDLVLSDWNMPRRGGLDLAREIRRLDEHVPIVLLTNEGAPARRTEAQRAGASDYLVKPFTATALRDKLARFGY